MTHNIFHKTSVLGVYHPISYQQQFDSFNEPVLAVFIAQLSKRTSDAFTHFLTLTITASASPKLSVTKLSVALVMAHSLSHLLFTLKSINL
jgi:hypothetical protein